MDSSKNEIETFTDVLRSRLDLLVICLSKSWGGLEQVAVQDALMIAAQGLKVRFMCLENSPAHEHLKPHPEVHLVVLDYRPRDYLDFRMRKELRALIKDGVNVVHIHQPTLLGSITPWLIPFPKVSLFVSRHIMSSHSKKDPIHAALYKRVDWLVVMSGALRRNVFETHPVRESQVKVIHLGLNFKAFDPKNVDRAVERKRWGIAEDEIAIGMVGRIDPAKGQGVFIRAAAGLMMDKSTEQHRTEKFKFVMVGEETRGAEIKFKDELEAMIREFQIQDHVIFTGYQENIAELMSIFDVFVMPSKQETFGLVAIEAMAMARAVIVSGGGSSSEIIGQNEYGLKMRTDDAFDLRQQLRYLVDHPEVREKLGNAARQHVLANFDQKVRLLKTLQLYDRGIKRRESF